MRINKELCHHKINKNEKKLGSTKRPYESSSVRIIYVPFVLASGNCLSGINQHSDTSNKIEIVVHIYSGRSVK